MKKAMLGFVFVMSIATASLAQNVTARANGRERAQHARIHQGRTSGEVTTGEARALNHEQRHIRRSERRAKADGTVTRQEKRRLERRQDRASRHIHRAKNNPIDNH
jgi:hypothetical protein